jgi:hypothetical protein
MPSHAELLPRFASGFARVPIVERQCGDARGGEVPFVLGQQHVVGRAETMSQH